MNDGCDGQWASVLQESLEQQARGMFVASVSNAWRMASKEDDC